MTAQDMINTVKDNLGNRASGRIGNRSVDVVILEALNLAVPHTVLEAQPSYYKRECTLAIVAGTRVYDLPVLDTDGKDIRIKDIYSVRCFRVGGTNVPMRQVNYADFVKSTPDYNLDTSGTPSCFALWGASNKLHLDFVPSESFTLTMYVESFPIAITDTQLSDPLPIHEEWNLVVEAFTTQHCYLKLQQLDMYTMWNDLYIKQKASVSRDSNEKDSHNISGGLSHGGYGADPALNPLVSRWN